MRKFILCAVIAMLITAPVGRIDHAGALEGSTEQGPKSHKHIAGVKYEDAKRQHNNIQITKPIDKSSISRTKGR